MYSIEQIEPKQSTLNFQRTKQMATTQKLTCMQDVFEYDYKLTDEDSKSGHSIDLDYDRGYILIRDRQYELWQTWMSHEKFMYGDEFDLLIQQRCYDMIKWAVENTDIDLPGRDDERVLMVNDNRCPLIDPLEHLAENHEYEFIKWLVTDARVHLRPYKNLIHTFMEHGATNMIKFTIENGGRWPDHSKYILKKFAHESNDEFVKWALENGCCPPNTLCTIFIEHQNYEMVKWAACHQRDYMSDHDDVYKMLTSHQRIDVIHWIIGHGCRDRGTYGSGTRFEVMHSNTTNDSAIKIQRAYLEKSYKPGGVGMMRVSKKHKLAISCSEFQ